MDDESKQWLKTEIKLAVLEGFNSHRDMDHKPLERRLSSLSRWVHSGQTLLAASAAWLGIHKQ